MEKPYRPVFTDFSGGWSPSRSPGSLDPRQLRDLNNYVIGPRGEIMTRPALLRADTDAAPTEIFHLNIVNGEHTTDTWGLLIGINSGANDYFLLDTTGQTALTDIDSSASNDPYPNIRSLRYKKIYYTFGDGLSNAFSQTAVRADVDDETDFQQISIDAPGSGPTLAAAAGGALPAAVYYGVVTFYNSRTGCESVISATGTATTAAGNLQIAWTNIPVASGAGTGAAQVDSRRLWRTLPNQTNEYYLVGTLADNTTTVFTDNVAVQSMGSRVSIDSQLAVGASGGPCIWRERYWQPASISAVGYGTSINSVAYSKVGLVEQFASDAFLPVGTDDTSDVVSCAAGDDFLIVFKYVGLWRITGTGPSNFRVDKLKSPAGLADTYAYALGPSGIFFLGSDGYFYVTDGTSVRNISERLGKLNLHVGPSEEGPSPTQVQSIVFPSRNWFMTVVYVPAAAESPVGSTATVYVYDYKQDAWCYWEFDPENAAKPRPRCFNLGYNSVGRAPRLYIGVQADSAAYVYYLEDDLFESDHNHTDVYTTTGEGGLADVSISPARSIRTKDFDALDFGGAAGDAFIVSQVYVRIFWPTSIEDGSTPDTNWDLKFTFKLYGDTNTGVVVPPILSNTGTIRWSTEDRANGQWHAIGLSSQQHAVTSIGLEAVSVEGEAPRRHSITGIGFEVKFINRDYIQAGQMLTANLTADISGNVVSGAGGTVYLCPSDPDVPSQSTTADISGDYTFADLPIGEYLIIGTDAGNTSSGIIDVTLDGISLVGQDIILDIPDGSSGCPIA